jgi:hypothetical protein
MSYRTLLSVSLPFITIFTVHYIAANMYAGVCAPLSPLGIIQSILMTGSPACGLILTIINHTNNAYTTLIAGIASTTLYMITGRPAKPVTTTTTESTPSQ